jgi:hypothetical protein
MNALLRLEAHNGRAVALQPRATPSRRSLVCRAVAQDNRGFGSIR